MPNLDQSESALSIGYSCRTVLTVFKTQFEVSDAMDSQHEIVKIIVLCDTRELKAEWVKMDIDKIEKVHTIGYRLKDAKVKLARISNMMLQE